MSYVRALQVLGVMNTQAHFTKDVSLQTQFDGNNTLLYQNPCHQGAVSIRKTVLPGMAIPMLKIRRPNGRLIFNMEIAIRR